MEGTAGSCVHTVSGLSNAESSRMHVLANIPTADKATTERVRVSVPFGFTERQARFLATVMLHSGVLVGRRAYTAFAGITHGVVLANSIR